VRTDICPICGLDASIREDSDALDVICARCGTFRIVKTALPGVEAVRKKGVRPESEQRNDWLLLQFLPAYTRQKSERGEKVKLNSRNWQDFAQQHSKTSEKQKLRKLLALIQKRTKITGHSALLNCDLDYPCIDAASLEECSQILHNLKDRKLLNSTRETGATYLVTLDVAGRQYLEEISRQVLTIGEMDYEAVPEASRQDLIKASDRYRSGDLSGALAAACAAVDSGCARVFEEKKLGDPTKVSSFQQKVMTSLRANGAFQRLESELISIGWNSEDAHRLAQNLEGSLNQAAYVMQTLRSKMSDAHGSKAVLEPVVFDSLKWAATIAVQLR
jgi:hypothetical protein